MAPGWSADCLSLLAYCAIASLHLVSACSVAYHITSDARTDLSLSCCNRKKETGHIALYVQCGSIKVESCSSQYPTG